MHLDIELIIPQCRYLSIGEFQYGANLTSGHLGHLQLVNNRAGLSGWAIVHMGHSGDGIHAGEIAADGKRVPVERENHLTLTGYGSDRLWRSGHGG